MSDTLNPEVNPDVNNETENVIPDELTLLKERATLMGIQFHPSIGVATLAAKIEAALASEQTAKLDDKANTNIPDPASVMPVESESQRNQRLRKEATKLVRINLTCMNPAKKDWPGEFISVGNSIIGTIKKYIPFNATAGYHVPHMIFEELKERQCQVFNTITLPNGNKTQKSKLIKEFAIEVLPNLTPEEIQELARKQAITNSVE